MTNAELTIENVVNLAEKIAADCCIPMQDAMDLAEFHLRYAAWNSEDQDNGPSVEKRRKL